MAGLQITTTPTTEPVTLQEAKEYLRLGDSTDERILQNFIETARMAAEDHMGRAIMPQTLSYFTDAYDELADPLPNYQPRHQMPKVRGLDHLEKGASQNDVFGAKMRLLK